jgi:hypothetical protein
MQSLKKQIYCISILILLTLFLQDFSIMPKLPEHIHSWAQSDRYAISLGFQDNGFDFFHPQTFVLNHQFPGDFQIPSDNSITAVDFPIHEYIVAGLMTVFDCQSPLIFRIYILLYSLMGVIFLYKAALLITENNAKALFVALFAMSSPLFLYYQSGFLPTIPSLANAFIGLYFFIKFIKEKNIRSFYVSILFFTLAALSRTPFAIYIIAILIVYLFNTIVRRKTDWRVFLSIGVSVLTVLGYSAYNICLRDKYGSMFLGNVMMAGSWQEIVGILDIIHEKWLYQYFTKIHYIYFLIVVIISFIVFFRRGIPKRGNQEIYLFLTAIIIGVIAYSYLMIRQFKSHDYYFIDTFFLPIVFILALSLKNIFIFQFKYHKIISIVLVIALSIPLFILADNVQEDRKDTGYWDRKSRTTKNFTDSKQLLDSLKIRPQARILVIDAYVPNIPFILIDRYGYAIMSTSEESISEALKWDYDYIVFQNEYFISDILVHYPDFINQVKVIGTNNKISVAERLPVYHKTSLLQFLGLEGLDPVIRQELSFDTIAAPGWKNINIIMKDSIVGEYAGLLKKSENFGITFTSKSPSFLRERSRILFVNGKVKTLEQNISKTYLAVSLSSKQASLYYAQFDLGAFIHQSGEWQAFSLSFYLPEMEVSDYELAVYLWNKGKNELYHDDIEILVY